MEPKKPEGAEPRIAEGESILSRIEGLQSLDPKIVEAFQEAMTKTVIPKAAEAVEERRLMAAESAQWQLKC